MQPGTNGKCDMTNDSRREHIVVFSILTIRVRVPLVHGYAHMKTSSDCDQLFHVFLKLLSVRVLRWGTLLQGGVGLNELMD